MNVERLMMGAVPTGIVLGVVSGAVTYAVAPPIQMPEPWQWLNAWGRIGVAVGVGWTVFVLTLVLSIFMLVFYSFTQMGGDL